MSHYFMDTNAAIGSGDGDDFGSVAWDTPTASGGAAARGASTSDAAVAASSSMHDVASYTSPRQQQGQSASAGPSTSGMTGVHSVQVKDGKVELEGTSDTFVSYLVTAKVNAKSDHLKGCGWPTRQR